MQWWMLDWAGIDWCQSEARYPDQFSFSETYGLYLLTGLHCPLQTDGIELEHSRPGNPGSMFC